MPRDILMDLLCKRSFSDPRTSFHPSILPSSAPHRQRAADPLERNDGRMPSLLAPALPWCLDACCLGACLPPLHLHFTALSRWVHTSFMTARQGGLANHS